MIPFSRSSRLVSTPEPMLIAPFDVGARRRRGSRRSRRRRRRSRGSGCRRRRSTGVLPSRISSPKIEIDAGFALRVLARAVDVAEAQRDRVEHVHAAGRARGTSRRPVCSRRTGSSVRAGRPRPRAGSSALAVDRAAGRGEDETVEADRPGGLDQVDGADDVDARRRWTGSSVEVRTFPWAARWKIVFGPTASTCPSTNSRSRMLAFDEIGSGGGRRGDVFELSGGQVVDDHDLVTAVREGHRKGDFR